MSAEHESPWVDDGTRADRPDLPERVPADAPIREIAPDDFVARSSKQTFRAALRTLEQQTSRRPAELPRCPECGSVNIKRKSTHAVVGGRVDTTFRCAKDGCRAHFDEPDAPLEAARPGEQATLSEVSDE